MANSHGDRAEEGRRSDRKHSANSLWERDKSCVLVGASTASQSRSEGFNRSWKSIVIKEKLRRDRTASVGVNPLNCTLGRYPKGFLPRVNEAASCFRERPNRPRNWLLRTLPRIVSKPERPRAWFSQHKSWKKEFTANPEDPVLENTSSRDLIGSIKSVCTNSSKVELKNCKQNVFIEIIIDLPLGFPINNIISLCSQKIYFLCSFCLENVNFIATTWYSTYFWEKHRDEKGHDLCQMDQAKLFEWRLHILFFNLRIFMYHSAKILQTRISSFYPLNRLFQNPLDSYFFEHIELPAKLLDYFLGSNKSNINQFDRFWVHHVSAIESTQTEAYVKVLQVLH